MPQELVIADFGGGRNTRFSQNMIADNEHQGSTSLNTSSQNVWVTDTGALAKRRGATLTDTGTVFTEGITNLFYSDIGSTTRLIIIGEYLAASISRQYPLITDNGTSFTVIGYDAGTCSVTSSTVTGSGTAWSTHVQANDYFQVDSDGTLRRITSVDSDTQLTLASAYPSNFGAGTAYTVRKQFASFTPMSILEMNNVVYFYDGTNTPQRYASTGTEVLNLATSVPAARYCVAHKNRVFMCRYGTTLSRVAWSDLRDPETFTTANFQDINPADGGDIRYIVEYAGYLVVFKRTGMWRIIGDVFDAANPDYVVERIPTPTNFNFTFGRTVVEFQGYLVFLIDDGFYRYPSATGGVEKVSDKIQPDVDQLSMFGVATTTLNPAGFSVVWKGRMWCTLTDRTGGTADVMLILDENWKWWLFYTTNAQVRPFAVGRFGASAAAIALYGGQANGDGLLTLDTGNSDNSLVINGIWVSKEFVFDNEVEFLYIDVYMLKQTAGSLSVDYSLDRAAYVTSSISMTSGQGTVIRERTTIARTGKAIRLRVQNNTADQTFEVYKIVVTYEPTEAFRV